MTATLALRLCGPFQAWGTQSRHEHRDSQDHPTKSGIIGMICNAMNIDHTDDDTLAELTKATFTTRVDHEPLIHTELDYIGNAPLALNKPGTKTIKTRNTLAERTALHDACYLVLLTYHSEELITRITDALRRPQRPPTLGRAAFITSPGMHVGNYSPGSDPLLNAPACLYHPAPQRPRIITETTPGDTQATLVYDNPISYRHGNRRHGPRYTREI